MPPANLVTGRLLFAPAAVPPYPFWCVYERLDGGAVAHVRYLGLLPRREDETAEALVSRAGERFACAGPERE